MTYPLTFHQYVLATRTKEDLTFAQTTQRFNVGIASVMRWVKKQNSSYETIKNRNI
ncbi:hypothetical protein ACGVWS_13055 [Enterobacteriaceae bacterium LUAb1]